LDVIRVLSRGVLSIPSVVLVTYREEELGRAGGLRAMLGELGPGPMRLRLEPLSPLAVASLAAGHAVDPRSLHARTGGNPFFVTEVLAAPGARTPTSVRDAVLARAARLGPSARRLLEAVAVVPGSAEVWLLESVAGADFGASGECLDSGMLLAGVRALGFRHDLARVAVAESTPPDRAVELHRAALAALAVPPDGSPDPARLAHHAAALGDPVEISRWALRAGVAAADSGAHREAASYYAEALGCGFRFEPEAEAELLERLAAERFLINELEAAGRDLDAVIALRPDDPRRLGPLLCRRAQVVHELGRTADADEWSARAVETLEPLGEGRELAEAYATRAQMRMLLGDRVGTEAWGRRAVELAERLDDKETLAHALNSVGAALLETGRPGGRELLERSLALARGNGLTAEAVRAFNNLVSGALTVRDFGLADTYLDDGLDYCAEHGMELWRRLLLADRATLALERSEWEVAGQTAGELLSDPTCSAHVRLSVLVVSAALALRRARSASSPEALFHEAQRLGATEGSVWSCTLVASVHAEALWLGAVRGEIESVTGRAWELASEAEDGWSLGELALWRRRLGVVDPLPPSAVAEPYRLSLTGDWRGAARVWEERGAPYRAALALADADQDDLLRDAHRRLGDLGADAAAATLARRLRSRGVRGVARGPRPHTRDNPGGLTARELDVARLLAAGLHNAEIAERLVVSRRTIDHHVSAILAKLEVADRRQAAIALARLGVDQDGQPGAPR
jgi:DNA-binding CsgD family transcriptional regulator/tetratricopeptide (TPR) repeat protein